MVPKMWARPLWASVWPYLDPWDGVRLHTASTHWNVTRKYGPHGQLFFFLFKKEPMVLSELVGFGPCISAEKVKACAGIGLHTMAEDALRSGRDVKIPFRCSHTFVCFQSRLDLRILTDVLDDLLLVQEKWPLFRSDQIRLRNHERHLIMSNAHVYICPFSV